MKFLIFGYTHKLNFMLLITSKTKNINDYNKNHSKKNWLQVFIFATNTPVSVYA